MIDYPQLTPQAQSREMIDVFGGYNANIRIGGGEFSDMLNLTSDYYPAVAHRKCRGVMYDVDKPSAASLPREGLLTGVVMTERWGVLYTQGKNLYGIGFNNQIAELDLNDQPKRFTLFGAYLIIMPDRKYINLNWFDDHGSIDHCVVMSEGTVTFRLCTVDGEVYGEHEASDTAPQSPADGALWIDTSADTHVLKRYSEASGEWVDIVSTYVKISGLNYGTDGGWFSQYDGITISGAVGEAISLNGSAVHYGQSNLALIVPGILDKTVIQDCSESPLRIERKAPEMDFIVEAGNRLWGCRLGVNGERSINEIYASKLGDFKNWNCFMGLSTDSWVGNLGSPGYFTGAANVGGSPVFYKRDCKHKVWISATGAHQITTIPCQGVAQGCGGSVDTVDGAAIYKSDIGFCMDDGADPVQIGQCFGTKRHSNAIGCVCGRKYYVSMEDKDDGSSHLFVYDIDKKMWHREDDFRAISLYGRSGVLCAIGEDGKKILDMTSEVSRADMETSVRWMAQTGDIGLSSPDAKYISRLTLRLYMEAGAELTAFAQYDMDEEWVALFSIQGTGLRSFSLPVRPRRCDHLRLRLEGVGDVKIYSITKTIEEGSELP